MSVERVIVIGASAGGVEALKGLVPRLDAGLRAAVFIVLHISPSAPGVLPRLLDRWSALRVRAARDGEAIEAGTVYVAPPDQHLLVERGYVRLVHGPKENGVRPAVDPLFRTAARAYGPGVVAVVLSGTLNDGTAALGLVKRRGGVVVAQDPEDALFDGMPRSAIEGGLTDHVCTIAEMAPLLERLTAQPAPGRAGEATMPEHEDVQDPVELSAREPGRVPRGAELTALTCPECQGSLWEMSEGSGTRYQCRVGHAYSEEFLLGEKGQEIEAALWTALTTIEENISLTRRLAERAERSGHGMRTSRYATRLRELERQALVLRSVLLKPQEVSATEAAVESVRE